MANTTNFNWETPDDTDLVKDGAAAIRTLGSAIDTSLVDLKGGTTGQVLSKATNTDMDFTWVAQDDSNAIQNAIVDAKGDLIAATANDTPARLAVGTNGQVLTADSTAATGLAWATASSSPTSYGYAAGKNAIINGDFRVNQRKFTSSGVSDTYGFDRWLQQFTGGTFTVSAQTFTAGTAPVAGYEGKNFVRCVTASQSAAGDYAYYVQRIEDVRTFANQTVTVSFWAKAASGTPKVSVEFSQFFGSGGSPSATARNYMGQVTLSTSWTRYSVTASVASISGKTLGTTDDSWLGLYLWTSGGTDYNSRTNSMGIQNATIDFWGVQVEAGSTATAFQTATGTIQGELAACQRYFWRAGGDSVQDRIFGNGIMVTTTTARHLLVFPVQMRTPSTITPSAASTFYLYGGAGAQIPTAVSISAITQQNCTVDATRSTSTIGQASLLQAVGTANAYIDVNGEL